MFRNKTGPQNWELRNSQPQSVLRFCVFGGQGFFGLTKKSQKPFVTGRFVATNHRGPVPKVTEPAPFCDLICQEGEAICVPTSQITFCLFFGFCKETSFFLLVS